MPNQINYFKELEKTVAAWHARGAVPSVLLHSCCAPCSSSCLEYLTPHCSVTVLYFNPNITTSEEYEYRLAEQKRLISEMPFVNPVNIIEGRYEPQEFFNMAAGLEDAPERGARCHKCYGMRLAETAKVAREQGFDYFATTLTLSPLKPSDVINSIGLSLNGSGEVMTGTEKYEYQSGRALYLPTDFKKNNGYLRSIQLSEQYGLYRQNYCGCIYSKRN